MCLRCIFNNNNFKDCFFLILFFLMSFITQGQSGLVINLEGKSQEILIYLNQKDFLTRKFYNISEKTYKDLEHDAIKISGSNYNIKRLKDYIYLPFYDSELLEYLKFNNIQFFPFKELIVPPPGDILPATPSYIAQQSYLQPNPGLNVESVWNLGFTGQNVTIHNIEYGFNKNHEEFHAFNCNIAPGMNVNSAATTSFTEHGTATMGVLFGNSGSYGITGIAHGAQQVWLYPEWQQSGYSRINAITNALNNSNVGDIVVYEMQSYGFNGSVSNPRFVPAEYDILVWNLTKALTDAGRIVIAAAGNGYQDLDSSDYQDYMNYGDSGAIIVGGGTANLVHQIYPPYVVNGITYSSTYGTRVDIQGWFENVRTTGAIPNSGFTLIGNDFNQSYMTFTGTSSATAQVGGVVAVLQSFYNSLTSNWLTSQQIRTILKTTGIPQGGDLTKNIGPLPNLLPAKDYVQQNLNTSSFTINDLIVYPNPSKDIFTISLGNLQPDSIEVYDVMGKLILKKNTISFANFQTSIDLSSVAQGIYFIKISANGQNSVKRIVKE